MKHSIVPVNKTTSASLSLTALPTAKIVRHPQSKRMQEDDFTVDPPDEETLKRLNAMAKQYPFCILHRGPHNRGLL
ncbi:MAG TPA: hypothetical protein VG101_19255 [Puia sp.]|jgi:hypothetical protein|nr:hypothetical protein [Puia sp.]